MRFSIHEIVTATKGTLAQGKEHGQVKGVSINSRTVKKGNLFVAIKGARFDGHDFIAQAVQQGAAAVVAAQKDVRLNRPKVPVILVEDTTIALGRLAGAHRDRFSIPVIAITGSAGKTTTKDLIADALQSRFNVLKNQGTENNQIGVPMTLFRLTPAHEAVVVEMGTNRFGDIKMLVEIARPTVAVMTNIGESHLELLESPSRVFQEKFELVKGLTGNGVVIFNADDPNLSRIPSLDKKHRHITFGIDRRARNRASAVEIQKNRILQFAVNRSHRFHLKTPVVANVYNALAAISCARLFNISYDAAAKRLARHRFSDGRQSLKKMSGCWLINDTYNANPVSVRSSLQTLSSMQVKGRKVFVCGDMLELGVRTIDLHREAGRTAAEAQVDLVLTFGKAARSLSHAAKESSPQLQAFHYDDLKMLGKKLVDYCRPGDAILVKGSRGMRMERVVDFLAGELTPGPTSRKGS